MGRRREDGRDQRRVDERHACLARAHSRRHADGRHARQRRRNVPHLGSQRALGARHRQFQRAPAQRFEPAEPRRARSLAGLHPRRRGSRPLPFLRRRNGQRRAEARPVCPRARHAFPGRVHRAQVRLPVARDGFRHAAVPRLRHLPASRRHLLHAARAAALRDFPGRRTQASSPRPTRRHRAPGDADPGIPDAVQHGLQRHGLLLARVRFRDRIRRASRLTSRA